LAEISVTWWTCQNASFPVPDLKRMYSTVQPKMGGTRNAGPERRDFPWIAWGSNQREIALGCICLAWSRPCGEWK